MLITRLSVPAFNNSRGCERERVVMGRAVATSCRTGRATVGTRLGLVWTHHPTASDDPRMRVGDAYPSSDLGRIRRERPCDQKDVPDTLPDGSHIVPDSSSRLEMRPSPLEEAGCWNRDTVFSFANRIYWNADAVFNFADRIYQNADAAI